MLKFLKDSVQNLAYCANLKVRKGKLFVDEDDTLTMFITIELFNLSCDVRIDTDNEGGFEVKFLGVTERMVK